MKSVDHAVEKGAITAVNQEVDLLDAFKGLNIEQARALLTSSADIFIAMPSQLDILFSLDRLTPQDYLARSWDKRLQQHSGFQDFTLPVTPRLHLELMAQVIDEIGGKIAITKTNCESLMKRAQKMVARNIFAEEVHRLPHRTVFS